jgi:DNA invertase Pin-like site-specific DNA recombinase
MNTEKIQLTHRERAAYVYVRQSSMQQVRHAQEGQKRQYGLESRAQELGFRQVVVIDEDLGKSGSGSVERSGFSRLLTAACQGTVGAIFALEASRLARNNRDWHHLIDLCAMTNTLVIDEDGVYDPRALNDRLLLGLKGSMAEFELGLMRQRAREALLQMIRRGLVLWEVPVGYRRTEDRSIEMIPDRQVQEAILGVFAQFRARGSARQVLLWYHQERISLPHLKPGTSGKEIVWRLPTYSYILRLLKNPAYAGTFVHGRSGCRTVVRDGRARKTYGHFLPVSEWKVVIHNHHPGYISWEEFLRHQQQLRGNQPMGSANPGAAKRGPALLAGLLRCVRCGRKLSVGYSGLSRMPRYVCHKGRSMIRGCEPCLSVGGSRLDQAVSATVLEALQPIGVQAAWEAVAQVRCADAEKRKALELALEKARYEAERARRQYDEVEPENRLVAAELEGRWNEALSRVAALESRCAETMSALGEFTAEEQERLLELGADLRELWNHPQAPMVLKKRILRTVLEEIIIDIRDEDPPKVHLRLHWAGGSHTELVVHKNRSGQHRRCATRDVVDLVRELAKVCRDRSIASILNRLGYRTGAGNTWKESRVTSLRHYHDIPACSPERTWLTLVEAAEELRVSRSVLRRLIQAKLLPAKQVIQHAPWVIERKDLNLPTVQDVIRAAGRGKRGPCPAPGQQELPYE